MFRKILVECIFVMAVVNSIAIASEESVVENPIPTILSETIPNWQEALKLDTLGSQFGSSVTFLKNTYDSSISKFSKISPKEKSLWDKDLSLLIESISYLSLTPKEYMSRKDSISELCNKLILTTNNGPYNKITLALENKAYKDGYKRILTSVLNNTWNLLWQARELLGFIVAINEQKTTLASLLDLFDQVKMGTSATNRIRTKYKNAIKSDTDEVLEIAR